MGQEAWGLFFTPEFGQRTHSSLDSPRRTPFRDLRRRQLAHPAWDMAAIASPLGLSPLDRTDYLLLATCGLLTGSCALDGVAPDAELSTFAAYAVHFFASQRLVSHSSDSCYVRLSTDDATQLAAGVASCNASIQTVAPPAAGANAARQMMGSWVATWRVG